MSRFISLSSTNKIFAIKSPSRHLFTFYIGVGRTPALLLWQSLRVISPGRLNSPFSITVRTARRLPLGHGQLLGGDDHHRYMTPIRATVEGIKELETVHLRHHQFEQDKRRGSDFPRARKGPTVRW